MDPRSSKVKYKTILSLIFLLILSACGKSGQSNYERAHAPWVFRSVLDDQARLLDLVFDGISEGCLRDGLELLLRRAGGQPGHHREPPMAVAR